MKSIETQFNEALKAIDKAGKRKRFNEASKNCTTIESKLNAAESVLAEAGVVREALKKNNGASDNGRAEYFTESANIFSEGYVNTKSNPFAKGDALLLESMRHPVTKQPITENEKRRLKGRLSVEGEKQFESLNEGQRNEFKFAVMCGISEADAFRLVSITGGYGSGHSKGWNHTN